MATVSDVAKYILEKTGEITVMKLQKLSFYAKAWGLVWDEEEMFQEEFEAWAGGAVSPALYERHRGLFRINATIFPYGNSDNVLDHQKETIDNVLDFYGKYTAQQLSDINHQESPWIDARGGLPPSARSNAIISTSSIAEYYSGVWNATEDE